MSEQERMADRVEAAADRVSDDAQGPRQLRDQLLDLAGKLRHPDPLVAPTGLTTSFALLTLGRRDPAIADELATLADEARAWPLTEV
jgi:hypothetical protein